MTPDTPMKEETMTEPQTRNGVALAAQRVPPETDAGRRLLALYDDSFIPEWETFGQAVAAIEAEARADALREAADRVRAEIRGEEAIARLTGSVDSIALIAGMNRALAAVDPESQP